VPKNADIDFQKIYPYYIISNRQNQLFFATFSSKIANLALCTNNPCAIRNILATSDNLIFPDGFPAAVFCKTPAFFLHRPPSGKGRLYGAAFSRRNRVSF
jgi:hypothetical protein